jgi:hypothetical protein
VRQAQNEKLLNNGYLFIYLFDLNDTFKNALYRFEILVRDISDMNINA